MQSKAVKLVLSKKQTKLKALGVMEVKRRKLMT